MRQRTCGRVVDFQYCDSELTKERPRGLSHAFVTYQVVDGLSEEVSVERITLRISGGADRQEGI